eukprot:SAG22_NODE_4970_length_1120_cov_0.674829_1_plen_73_part_00
MLTSATAATLGLSLTIPIGFCTDYVLHGAVPDVLSVAGAAMVVGGFLTISVHSAASRSRGNGDDDKGRSAGE